MAKNKGIPDKQWADASKIYPSRLSEIRSMVNLKFSNKKLDRIFSVKKCVDLVEGLIALIGGELVRKELLRDE